jgi:transposase
MGRPSKYPDELRERAVRMVAEVRPQYPSQWAAITAVAGMLGIGAAETLRTWIRRAEVDTGRAVVVGAGASRPHRRLGGRKSLGGSRKPGVWPWPVQARVMIHQMQYAAVKLT